MTTTIISADSHVTEPPHTYVDRIDRAWRDRAPRVVRDARRGDLFVIDGLEKPIPMGLVAAAGKRSEDLTMFGAKFEELHRGGWDPEARLLDQDTDGVAAEVVSPTVGMMLCNHPDFDYKHACFQAYNRWLAEFCGAHPDRLIGIGQTALRSLEDGIADLQAIKALGLRGVMLPGNPNGPDYDDPSWAPFFEAAIDQDALSRQYRLGPAVLELGAAVKINRELRDVVRPVMFELANKTRLTAYVGVLAGDEALCVERVEGSSPVQVRMWLSGSRMALNCGAGPRVLLAHLDEPRIQEIVAGPLARITVRSQVNAKLLLRDLRRIRSRGWELAVDDVTIGAAAVGVPLRDRAGTVVAALSLAGLTQQIVQRGRPRFLTDMLAAVRRISPQLHAP